MQQVIDYILNNLAANRYLIVSLAAYYAFAFLIARRAARRGENADKIWSLSVWMGIGALLGGYLGFLLINSAIFVQDPGLLLGNFGVTFYGVLTGGLLGAWFGASRARVGLGHVAALMAPFLPLTIALDRVGCLVGPSACLGGAMDAPFGVWFPGETVARFPSHLVEGGAALLIFAGVLLIERKRRQWDVLPFILGLGAYALVRSAVDFTRLPINPGWMQLEVAIGFFIAFLALGHLVMQALSPKLAEAAGETHKVREHYQMQPHRARAPRRKRSEHVAPEAAAPSSADHK